VPLESEASRSYDRPARAHLLINGRRPTNGQIAARTAWNQSETGFAFRLHEMGKCDSQIDSDAAAGERARQPVPTCPQSVAAGRDHAPVPAKIVWSD
jgi:hypothetical protein